MLNKLHKAALVKAALAAGFLLLGSGAALAQQVVNLTAGPTTLNNPDGTTVPMWGYSCGTAVTGTTASCAALNANAGTGWSPVIITVPVAASGPTSLTINLTNRLSFTPAGSTIPNAIPTSLTIVGQVGGGLGTPTKVASPAHSPQSVTWSTVGTSPAWFPPGQGPRVQSFGTEVEAAAATVTPACASVTSGTAAGCAALTWSNLRPGTYLLESGTHPSIQVPMGLIGMVVVTSAPSGSTAGTAYAGVSYNSEVPILMSEVDPVQNTEVDTAVRTAGFNETAVWSGQNSNRNVTALAVTAGGSGYLTAPTVTISGGGGTGATATASVTPVVVASIASITDPTLTGPLTVSITDPTGTGATATATIQSGSVVFTVTSGGSGYSKPTVTVSDSSSPAHTNSTAIATLSGGSVSGLTLTSGGSGYTSVPIVSISGAGTGAAATASISPGQCVGGVNTCYPPAINYTPLYYAINGVSFSKANAPASLFAATAGVDSTGAPVTLGIRGTTLVRLVNAGLRMHVPSILDSLTLPVGANTAPTTPVPGFSLVAEDGNRLPGVQKVQHEVFMAAGKTFDVMVNAPAVATTLPLYDREGSLSANAIDRDGGMLAYIGINGGKIAKGIGGTGAAVARADTYNSLVAGQPLTVADPSRGVIANDTNVYGVTLLVAPQNGTVALAANGTFTYTPAAAATSDTFTYCANGTVAGAVCSSGITAIVSLNAATLEGASGITCSGPSFKANTNAYLTVANPGVLAGCVDAAGYPLTATGFAAGAGLTVTGDAAGGFTAAATTPCTAAAGCPLTFTFLAKNSQGTAIAAPVTATVTFPAGSGLNVTVLDGYTKDPASPITDYRWVIEEDQTYYINPNCTQNPPPAGCPTASSGIVPTLGVNFHTSHMPFVAQGCTGPKSCEYGQSVQGKPVVCDVGNGLCRPDAGNGTSNGGFTWVSPSQVALDPGKHYYLTVFPGDAADPFVAGYAGSGCQNGAANAASGATCGHGMGGAEVMCAPPPAAACTAFPPVTVLTQPTPFPPGKLSVFVFEDDFPLNGEQDGGGGVDVLSPNEPGLGNFQIHLWDAQGADGDFTGQMTYDMFNQPLTNSLAGMKDPVTNADACPISVDPLRATSAAAPAALATDPTATGKTGMIVTCPKYESDGKTLSPLAGFAVIDNLMPGRWGVIATPGADRIARGEEWLQTNTLDGQKAHDVFTRISEPSYFQEFSPAGPHVKIGFANPAIINARLKYVCDGSDPNLPPPAGQTTNSCHNTLTGRVTGQRLSRTPDERLYSSGSHDAFAWTQCYISVGDPDGEDFAFTKCNADGTFTLSGLPDGDWRITTFDQWNDQLVDGLSTPVRLGNTSNLCPGSGSSQHTCNMGDIASTQWQTNLQTRTCIDEKHDGICESGDGGVSFANVAVRKRDGSIENLQVSDMSGVANFNETFPLFSWYTVETDVTRYKNTGTHVVYDVGGPADGATSRDVNGVTVTCTPAGTGGYPPCGNSTIGKGLANTAELVSLPQALRVPGTVYCADADCSTHAGGGSNGIQWAAGANPGANPSDPPSVCSTAATAPFATTCTTNLSSGRVDNPWLGANEGWQGFPGQFSFIEFGKEPYSPGENGGIRGHVVYASTRPFDDPQMLVQTSWEPLIPNVTVNLYREGAAADGVTPTLKLVDTTTTSSWDAWAQGFHLAADGVTRIPNMNCPGQGSDSGTIPDLFFFSLDKQPDYLDWYGAQHGGPPVTPLPYNSQFKCYDGMHNWNQLQPAPYDGQYRFPSITSYDPSTGKPNGTNCKICVPDPVLAPDLYSNVPMLPAGKYVVEVVVPPGFELVKEEDKNILIGDNFVAPVTQQFGGLGNVFIMPDQASVAAVTTGPWAGSGQWAGAGYNAKNPQNPTQNLGAQPQNGIVPGFVPEPVWPCVGESRVVPDYISLFPQSKQAAPFAGATRHLCDRKEVTLSDQMAAIAKFYLYTSTHVASKFTGGITNDLTSEFDPFSSQFGEKFSPPDLPVSVKDWTGNEISRVYADQWGAYNGMTYSSWEVNPPNPTGYSPSMMVLCMNDQGPIPGPNGTQVSDPLFNSGYSQFCYELPFMPGTTTYLDTPVVPTSGFAGAGYNDVDCSYPDATPAIAEVDGDGVGPWIGAAGSAHPITITALGDQQVRNFGYSGPSFGTAPWNQKTVNRHYGFGSTPGTVTIGKYTVPAANITTWTDSSIVLTIPTTNTIPECALQQQERYQGDLPPGQSDTALCGQLLITAANGKQSIDTVTVTIGGKTPTHVAASASVQAAIDAAAPGDLLIIDPTCNTATTAGVACSAAGVTGKTTATHQELLVMWKPVRLQGVGAASSVLNANAHPAGKLDPWRRDVNCLFGLSLNGYPIAAGNPYDPTGGYSCSAGSGRSYSTIGPDGYTWNYFNPTANNPQIDRLPLEATLGWDASLNGNLAELLQEPSLMGALEGAGITVLAKGVYFPSNPYDPALAAGFPTGTVLFTHGNRDSRVTSGGPKPCDGSFPSNFWCNPSGVDGLGLTNGSQGGGAIYVHGWGHNMQIANNHVYGNVATLSAISIGQGEFAGSYLQGSATNAAPGSCESSDVTNAQLPYCHNMHVDVHNNNISLNSSLGDELFSATPAGAGGVSFCTGADYYKFNYNWVCGNLSTGDGGGFGHLGYSKNGHIEHNTIIFNQSSNPTIPANGGGMIIMGTPDIDPTCGATTDLDCLALGPSDGVGPGLVIDSNLIMGNSAESGSGGGVAFQNVNGNDVVTFPNDPRPSGSSPGWHHILFQNNIVADNVAGWDGAGISLLDAFYTDIVNNTIVSNSTTASAGTLANTIGAPLASTTNHTNANCSNGNATASCPQPSGLVSLQTSANLEAAMPATITCPPGHYAPDTPRTGPTTGVGAVSCSQISYPLIKSNIFWQNSAYYIGIGSFSTQFQQNVVALYNAFTGTPAPSQPTAAATTPTPNGLGATITGGTGACIVGSAGNPPSFWDIGVRGDTGPVNHTAFTLNPTYSLISSGDYAGTGNSGGNPNFVSQYCNGSRIPPEACANVAGGCGWQVPPGIADATVPNPIFNLTPVATVDEGNNWINLRWGPLSLVNPLTNALIGNYSLSAAIDTVPNSVGHPASDFFGNPRPDAGVPGSFDPGAVEFVGGTPLGTLSFSSATNGNLDNGDGSSNTLRFTIPSPRAPVTSVVTITNTGSGPLQITAATLTSNASGLFSITGTTCTAPLAINGSCTVSVQYATPATRPASANTAILAVANNGIGTTYGSTSLALSAR